eukprot:TRINITY_DN27123_c0_g1_i1.p1 TRINITY_DN27123_c0_g1~~TRINITY_DN27123_c0_g1_i1.p1  ORF type:complete len:512 (-),score=96.87 TRINITY_DN27123_c0_g1_i1:34-1569(-)
MRCAGRVAVLALALVSLVRAAVVEVNLTVEVFRFGSADTPISFNTRGYNGAIPGPTIRVKPGDTLTINLANQLLPDTDGLANTFRLVNTTNLHLHGMHLSPMNLSDDVFRRVAPGSTATYQYTIPADHSPGTFWYHPHVAGSSSLQQGGGMAGTLIVDPLDNDSLPVELAAMKEEILLLQHLCFHNRGKYQDSTPYLNHLNVVKYSGDLVAPEPSFKFPDQVPSYYLVNGQFQPNITMQPGEFRRLRLIGGGTSVFLELRLTPEHPNQTACDIYVIAKDGVYVEQAYTDSFPLLVPGSRLDLAVRCNSTGRYSLASQPDAPYNSKLMESTAVFQGTIASLVVAGEAMTMAAPNKLPPRPAYMPDLRNSAAATQFNVAFETLGGPFVPGPPFPVMRINGQSFSNKDNYVLNITLNKLQEWVVGIAGASNLGAGNHPFHLHVNPFQVVSIGTEPDDILLGIKVGEYRDTLPLISFARLVIRFVPDRFTGRVLFHCHLTPHVDLGMAAVVNISL